MTYATSMRVKPIERQAIKSGAITKHNARTGKLQENVDKERVDLNRVLVGTADPARDLATEIDGVPMSRKGENPSLEFVGAEIVLTAHHEFFEQLSEQDFEKWVTKNIEYLQKKFDGVGEHGKLVSAILHMDEKPSKYNTDSTVLVSAEKLFPVSVLSDPDAMREILQRKEVREKIEKDTQEWYAKCMAENKAKLDQPRPAAPAISGTVKPDWQTVSDEL